MPGDKDSLRALLEYTTIRLMLGNAKVLSMAVLIRWRSRCRWLLQRFTCAHGVAPSYSCRACPGFLWAAGTYRPNGWTRWPQACARLPACSGPSTCPSWTALMRSAPSHAIVLLFQPVHLLGFGSPQALLSVWIWSWPVLLGILIPRNCSHRVWDL